MNKHVRKKILQKLLRKKSGYNRLVLAWISLYAGTTLLLASVMIWWNLTLLLKGNAEQDSLGSSFITIGKRVTNEKMGNPNLTVFSDSEIAALQQIPGVTATGVLSSGQFPASISLSGRMDFSSDLFLSSVPDIFLDKKPEAWHWLPQSRDIPLILPSEFLHLYNYGFALSQGLPQLSETSLEALSFDLSIGAAAIRETYTARIAGFSDRITAALVPQNFMEYANRKYGSGITQQPSRVILRITDPSDKAFTAFLQQHDYTVNAEQLKWSRLRIVAEVVAGTTGLLALLLTGISILVFVLFIELTISRSREALTLLLLTGYSPQFLKRFFTWQFIPLLLSAIAMALLSACLLQYILYILSSKIQLSLPFFPGYHIWTVGMCCTILFSGMIRLAVVRGMDKEAH